MQRELIAITGQTATGKTSLALELAAKHDGEVVNFDSRQIYKRLDIVTGKDLPAGSKFKCVRTLDSFDIGYYEFTGIELGVPGSGRGKTVKVWLYDIADPKTPFSSYDFVTCARKTIRDITSRNKTPVLVGGSYFYLKHLIYGFEAGAPPDSRLRSRFAGMSAKEMRESMLSESPGFSGVLENMNGSDLNNPRRLVRRYEIHLSGISGRGSDEKSGTVPRIFIGLRYADRGDLKETIARRVRDRIRSGALDEVRSLLGSGYGPGDPGMRTIGYVQIFGYLQGEYSRDVMIGKWITAEMQYAKRQLTFMKKDPNIVWKEI